MKPQLVAMDSPGAHNANMATSVARMLRGGSWKHQRIVSMIPAGDKIPTKVYLSHCSLIYPPNQGVYRLAAMGMEVGEAYSNAIAEVLANPGLAEWEFLLTIEHDNIPPQDGVIRLVEDMEKHPELSCIGGLYWTKGPQGVPQIWGDPNDKAINFRPQVPVPNTVQECCGTGMGFNLWRMSMFKDQRLRRPWFKTIAGAEGVGTQDLYFWSDARKYGYRCAIDTGILVGHYDMEGSFGPPDTTW